MVVTACGITGKAAMKIEAATCVSVKNELICQGGTAPIQWYLEEELGQPRVLEHQTDSATEFRQRAK